jgi:hypothetical protein
VDKIDYYSVEQWRLASIGLSRPPFKLPSLSEPPSTLGLLVSSTRPYLICLVSFVISCWSWGPSGRSTYSTTPSFPRLRCPSAFLQSFVPSCFTT